MNWKLPLPRPALIAAATLTGTLAAPLAAQGNGAADPCRASAIATLQACRRQALADFWLARANCVNFQAPSEREACSQDAWDVLEESVDMCDDQYDARRSLCTRLGAGFYDPEIEPEDFVAVIDNPYLPLLPGAHLVYEKQTPEGLERIDYIVTNATKEILGVECTVVHDIVTLAGEVTEDTFDWFAQDEDGNVWYFGELSFEYEGGELVGTAGSWKAGVDFAKPGIVMLADPVVGAVYRQEFLIGEAEDAAAVLSTSAVAQVPWGQFTNCLVTEDFTPITPGPLEHKFYAQGVGLVLELDPSTGARTELISVTFE